MDPVRPTFAALAELTARPALALTERALHAARDILSRAPSVRNPTVVLAILTGIASVDPVRPMSAALMDLDALLAMPLVPAQLVPVSKPTFSTPPLAVALAWLQTGEVVPTTASVRAGLARAAFVAPMEVDALLALLPPAHARPVPRPTFLTASCVLPRSLRVTLAGTMANAQARPARLIAALMEPGALIAMLLENARLAVPRSR